MEKIRFDNFVSLNRGFDLPDDKIIDGKYPVIASTSIKAYHNQFKVKAPIVVTGRSGSLGKVQYVDEDGWPLNTALYAKDFHGNNPKYVYYFLQTMHLEQYNAGAGVPTLNQNHLHSLKVLIHKLPTQQKIASILSAYDNLIQNYKKQIEALQTAASELYKEWFVRFRFPGWQNAKFENGIPEGWKYLKLSEFGYEVESGNRPAGGIDDSLEDGIPSLGAESIDKLGYFDYSNVKLVPREFYDKMKRGHGKDNDILLYKDGAYIGKVTLFRNGFPFKEYAVNEHVFLLRSNNKDYQNYLYFTLNMSQYFTQMQNLNRNAAQPGLARGDLDRIKILVPNEKGIEKFNKLINPMIDNIFSYSKQITNLTQQRDLLLPRLMSGKLEVE
ncbi:restriction endonuclease subunit S [Treponema succinifaciens]|uniref:restriction endonuclease subunit S n=1 Tax=Treponema succinifaciens TaxID=167 RepID=UPI0023527C3E|nr:restriction endonuclease subunit S [Treponema succinifaciens]